MDFLRNTEIFFGLPSVDEEEILCCEKVITLLRFRSIIDRGLD